MTRSRKLGLNLFFSIFNHTITLICGLIIPKLFIVYFGSNTNGLLSSISQFLSIIAFFELGVGAVVQASLYKPLAENDTIEISRIVIACERFFRFVATLLVIYSIVLCFIYPRIIKTSFTTRYTVILIVIISLSSFSQYYFGLTYQILLNADQLSFICLIINSSTLLLSTIISFILVKTGNSLLIAKSLSTLVFMIRPILYRYIIRKRYCIIKKIEILDEPIKQKWNGVAQHIAYVVLNNTDIIVLTTFCSLELVSVYSVYFMVINGIRQFVIAFTNGIKSLFGDMIARNEIELLNITFEGFEWIIHTISVTLFLITGILIIPFISVYTKDVQDFSYIYPLFGWVLTVALAIYCIRAPYQMMVHAAGHFKETQLSSIIEAVINVLLTILLVRKFQLVGVAIGTLVAMMYRTLYLVWYLSKKIINRNLKYFFSQLGIDIITVILVLYSTKWLNLKSNTFYQWIIDAIIVSLICFIEIIIINYYTNRNKMINVIKILRKYFRK